MKRIALAASPLFLLAALTGCGSVSDTSGAGSSESSSASAEDTKKSTPKATKKAERTVTYSVTGDGASTSISYFTLNGGKTGQSQANGEDLPWKKTVKIKDDSLFSSSIFSLTAQAAAGTKKITCTITADGKVISKESSTGDYAVVSCSGSAG